MLLRPQEFLDVISALCKRFDIRRTPAVRSLRRCYIDLLRYNDGSGDPVIEAAALFFALSVDEARLGNDARRVLPVVAAMASLFEQRLMVPPHHLPELRRLQDDIAAGLGWPSTRTWFVDHVVSRPRSSLFPIK